MAYNPTFQYNNRIVAILGEINYLRGVIDSTFLPREHEGAIRKEARFKSTHYSTAIEGNPLSLDDVKQIVNNKAVNLKQAEQEVRNYWRALAYLQKSKSRHIPITEAFIRRLHAIIQYDEEKKAPPKQLSSYRFPLFDRQFGVVNHQTGQYEYIPPDAQLVPSLMADLIAWVNSEAAKALPTPIRAAIFAYQLVTIHPFFDGNGRLCRAMSNYIMMLDGYDLNGYFSIEEYYFNDLTAYYENLQMGLPPEYAQGRNAPDLTPWIEYYLQTTLEAYRSIAQTTRAFSEQAKAKLAGLGPKERDFIKYAIRFNHLPMKPGTIADLFNVSRRTIMYWLENWLKIGLVEPASGKERITSYRLSPKYQQITLEDLGIDDK